MKQIFIIILFTGYVTALTSQSVGIGTNSPSASSILEIKSSTKGFIFPRTSTTSRLAMAGVKGLFVYDTTDNKTYYHTGTGWQQVTTGSHPTTYWNPAGTHIYNSNSGNVGIGILIPTRKLSVNNEVIVTGDDPVVEISGNGDAPQASLVFEMTNNATDYIITQAFNALWISRQTGAFGYVGDFILTDNGYIGMGIGNPDTKLNIDGGTDVGPVSGGYLQLGPTTGSNMGIDVNEIQARDGTGPSRLVLQNDGGPVQIGNAITPDGYKVAVNGKVICEELKIKNSGDWPDYVFADHYELKSMDDLRNFILAYHHLPNIPSASEIETEGILLGDMQKRMMEKIEELTLYVLLLEEKYSAVVKEISNLKDSH